MKGEKPGVYVSYNKNRWNDNGCGDTGSGTSAGAFRSSTGGRSAKPRWYQRSPCTRRNALFFINGYSGAICHPVIGWKIAQTDFRKFCLAGLYVSPLALSGPQVFPSQTEGWCIVRFATGWYLWSLTEHSAGFGMIPAKLRVPGSLICQQNGTVGIDADHNSTVRVAGNS